MAYVRDLHRRKVLIVDPAPFRRAATAGILARSGFATVQVREACRTLDSVRVESPDAVILDSLVPGPEGFQVCQRLKGDSFTRHIPILVFTAPGSAPGRFNALKTGADAFLSRPFLQAELVSQIESLLSRHSGFDPLTGLATAPALHRQIDALLAQNRSIGVAYFNLDHLAVYDELYGRAQRDQVLKTVARLLVESLPHGAACAGYLGGGNFLVMLPAGGAATFTQTAVDRFADRAPGFYSEADARRGRVYLMGANGEMQERPLLTLSAALVTNRDRPLVNYVQVAEILSGIMADNRHTGGGCPVGACRLNGGPA